MRLAHPISISTIAVWIISFGYGVSGQTINQPAEDPIPRSAPSISAPSPPPLPATDSDPSSNNRGSAAGIFSLRDASWVEAVGTNFAAFVALVGMGLAFYMARRQLRTAVDLHRDASSREHLRAEQSRKALATALYAEIHNRSARFVLDGITWATKHVDGNIPRDRHDTQKFRPFPPVVYTSMADRLLELPPEIGHRVIRFYNALEAADSQIRNLIENPGAFYHSLGNLLPTQKISSDESFLVTVRMHQTLQPALDALRALGAFLGDTSQLEKTLRNGDLQYLGEPTVLTALQTAAGPSLREALGVRIKWFSQHLKLSAFAHLHAEGSEAGQGT